ncbi:oxidoreductase [Dyadobacter flavalbus]|uniref:Oxidoreductase n=2 Tax=Dyadobacter flavalbus TaxID=2579942 RepID=A0A5M8R241_9BACT|nr:oxidoreductase [Dyadobacter flavalbus]
MLLVLFLPWPVTAQWKVLDVKTKINMRAVHAVSPSICWIGGSNGTILKTTDAGHTWLTYKVSGADSMDFRDIHAFDKQNAIAMSAGESEKGKAKIFRTEDGGESWSLVYQTTQNGVFLDGIDFWDKNRGICLGDPVEGKLFILVTEDGGESWTALPLEKRPATLPGEACFAASGTSILTAGKSSVYIGTGGGKMARVFRSEDYGQTWQVSETPLPAGPTSGIFGLRFWSKKNGMAVGGDYKRTTDSTRNVLITNDGGITWELQNSMTKPAGLKECVDIYHKTNATWNGDTQIRSDNYALVASGPSGSSFSLDRGKTWRLLGKEGFHALSFAGNVGYAVGANGLIGKIDLISTKNKKRKLVVVEE